MSAPNERRGSAQRQRRSRVADAASTLRQENRRGTVRRMGTSVAVIATRTQQSMDITALASGVTASRSAKIRALGYLREALVAPLLIRRRKKD